MGALLALVASAVCYMIEKWILYTRTNSKVSFGSSVAKYFTHEFEFCLWCLTMGIITEELIVDIVNQVPFRVKTPTWVLFILAGLNYFVNSERLQENLYKFIHPRMASPKAKADNTQRKAKSHKECYDQMKEEYDDDYDLANPAGVRLSKVKEIQQDFARDLAHQECDDSLDLGDTAGLIPGEIVYGKCEEVGVGCGKDEGL